MTLTANDGRTVFSATEPSTPRLRLQPGTAPELLDGGWWPRSTDPVAEIPGLVLAIDALHGPITRLMLHTKDWDSHPRRLAVDGRLVRLGYFASQPIGLLTALSGKAGDRVDLVVIPPDTAPETAEAALALAATNGNRIHAQDVVATVIG
jgi:N-acyl-D-aspartate/D-glutamate deacylase